MSFKKLITNFSLAILLVQQAQAELAFIAYLNGSIITDPLGYQTIYGYDQMNRLTFITDPNGSTWSFQYDEIGQLISLTDPLGSITGRTYDLNRNLKTIIDAETHITEYFYDPANQLTQTLNADGGTIDYTYTLLGKVETLTDPNKNTTMFGYDSIGRLTSETDPLGYTTGYEYDKNHNLIEKNTPNGHTLTYSYDKLNRLTQKVTPEQTYAFTCDSLSRLTNALNYGSSGVENPTSNLSFVFDAVGQLIQSSLVASDSSLVNISYSYDGAGRKTSLSDPTGSTSYGFDKAYRLTNIADPQGNSFTIGYDKAGRRLSLTGPGGHERSYDYDKANRLLELINKVNGVEIAPFQYVYDKAGNRTSIVDKWGDYLAEYDQTYKLLSLTNALATGGTETFSYDLTGNRTSDVTQSYEPNALNQIVSGTSGLSLYYDNNGNLISKIQDGITWTYSWSSDDKLLSATSSDEKSISYQYDALGRRISKTVNGETLQFVYDGDDILLEYQNGVLSSRYTHGPAVDEPLAKTELATEQNYYYHSDALGSITSVTNASGNIVESYRYSSYGVPSIYDKDGLEISKSTIVNFYNFTGREFDQETNLYYYRARYYDPVIGRFISRDPFGFDDGPNLYTYTHNNPINWVDPWGMDDKKNFSEKLEDLLREATNDFQYEKYGGPGLSGPGAPVDQMDAYFETHDTIYNKPLENYHRSDINLIDQLEGLPPDPRDWIPPALNMDKAKRYRDFATEIFKKKIEQYHRDNPEERNDCPYYQEYGR